VKGTRKLAVLGLAGVLAATGAADAQFLQRPAGGEDLLHNVQVREADVFFDGRGNRILLDRETGEVISVRPMRPRERLRPMRRLPDDYVTEPAPDYGQGDPSVFPEAPSAPRDYSRGEAVPDETREPAPDVARGEARPRPIERKPLAPAARPGDEPIFREPDGEQATATPPATENPASDTPIFEDPGETTTGAIAATEPMPTTEPAATAPSSGTSIIIPGVSGAREEVAALQILLDRGGSSPGVIDGRFCSNVDRAIVAYRRLTGRNIKSTDTVGITAALAETGGDAFTTYTLTAEDVAGPYVASVPEDYSEKAKLDRMSYTSVTEALGERFHMDENYLKAINPEADFKRVGTIVKVANVGQNVKAKVARITADKKNKQVLAYDAYDKLVAAYPATIGSSDTPSPTGTHQVSRIAFNPEYTYNPKINFKQGQNDKVLTIPPGPNGPVGSIWIALDKPTYGVHGTPEPSKIGKTESHGCVRLTNWDAAELAKLVTSGVTVEFLE